MLVWVIGAGGLLGSALVRVGASRDQDIVTSSNVSWNSPHEALIQLEADANRFLTYARHTDQRWAIVWAAGQATTASSRHETAQELSLFKSFLESLASLISTQFPNPEEGFPGVFCLISSAGGVYAGASQPPFSAHSTPSPLGNYGHLKVEQERLANEILGPTCAVVILRVANLYGPGQNLAKLQGLISRLALASIAREPISMFVPLDTLRDFIYVDDAAEDILHWIETAEPGVHVRVIASGNPVALGYLISLMEDISHSRIPVAYGMHPSAAAQGRDIRLIPDTDAWLEGLNRITLPAGMKNVYLDILARQQAHT